MHSDKCACMFPCRVQCHIHYNIGGDLKVDYAHEATGFPTWHRQYLLWLEWEIQYMLKESRPNDYHEFRLHYWDWRRERQTDQNSPFKRDRLGTTEIDNGSPVVRGDVIGDSWHTVCWDTSTNDKSRAAPLCNPTMNNAMRLQRCPVTQNGMSPCAANNQNWPTENDVNTALKKNIYDASPFNKTASDGFRNFLEGFQVVDDCGGNEFCDNNLQRWLHNTVSLILHTPYYFKTLLHVDSYHSWWRYFASTEATRTTSTGSYG